MPAPPDIGAFDKIKFVVDYFWQGCSPSGWLDVTLSEPPEKDLALLFLGLDWEDIGQTLIEPRGGRKRRSGRHGRKSGRRIRFPDPNDMVGNRIRGRLNPYDAFRKTPVRYVFPIINSIEAVNFTAAVLEGVTDVGFDRVWGLLTFNPDQCPNFAFFERRTDGYVDIIGAAPSKYAINFGKLVSNQGFFTPHGTGWGREGRPYSVGANVRVESIGASDAKNVRVQLIETVSGEIVDESGSFNLDVGDSTWISLSGDIENGKYTYVGRSSQQGSLRFSNGSVLGHANDRYK